MCKFDESSLLAELPVVGAIRSLSIFGADQAGAYREHFSAVAEVLGESIPTRLTDAVQSWARSGRPGLWLLTGNAGTGKTAAAQVYCGAHGGDLPTTDEPIEVAPGRLVAKDISGLPDRPRRAAAIDAALRALRSGGQALVCANEGVLRDALLDLGDRAVELQAAVETALRVGATRSDGVVVINLNRQRPTAEGLWERLLNYVTNEAAWSGCADCPADGAGCPMRENAAALRRPEVREALRLVVRIGSGDAIPTLREVLAMLAWAIVGDASCKKVKEDARDRGREGFTAEEGYFARALSHGLNAEKVERSPLMAGIRSCGLGGVSDLEVDGWLRDTTNAPPEIQRAAGALRVDSSDAGDGEVATGPLAGTRSLHDRVATAVGTMTFHTMGETISTSEDVERVERCLDALVGQPPLEIPRQALWRQRVFFEEHDALGGLGSACARLLSFRYFAEFVALCQAVARGEDPVLELAELVKGLNFLVCGFSSSTEGLLVPDQACLFARDPGSFRPARPSLVHSQVRLDDLSLSAPDSGIVAELLDVDHLDVELVARANPNLGLRIRPRLYEAIREAASFQGPVGQGIAEMTDLRGFYGRLALALPSDGTLRVADPMREPPALITLTLPHRER